MFCQRDLCAALSVWLVLCILDQDLPFLHLFLAVQYLSGGHFPSQIFLVGLVHVFFPVSPDSTQIVRGFLLAQSDEVVQVPTLHLGLKNLQHILLTIFSPWFPTPVRWVTVLAWQTVPVAAARTQADLLTSWSSFLAHTLQRKRLTIRVVRTEFWKKANYQSYPKVCVMLPGTLHLSPSPHTSSGLQLHPVGGWHVWPGLWPVLLPPFLTTSLHTSLPGTAEQSALVLQVTTGQTIHTN